MKTAGHVETLHLTKVRAAAETIRDALRLQGREARVVALPDDFSIGPLEPPDPDARREWVRTVLRRPLEYDQFEAEDGRGEPEQAWVEAASGSVHPVFWVCLANAYEHASFLAFVDHMAGRPFDVVDATDLDIVEASGFKVVQRGLRTIPGLVALRPEDIVASGLERRRRPFTPAEGEAARAAWARLRWENAPLRIMRDGELVSAPLTHFDQVLADQAAPEWEKAGYLIGRTMVHLAEEMKPPVHSPNDTVLFGRILALGEAGALEVTGPGPSMRDYRVRAPAAREVGRTEPVTRR